MLQFCVCRLSVTTICIVAKRCVLEQKLLLTAYRKSTYKKSIGTKINDRDLSLEIVLRSCQPLRNIGHWISRKPTERERLGSKGPPNGESNGHMIDDVMWPIKVKLVPLIRLECNISKIAASYATAIWHYFAELHFISFFLTLSVY